MFMPNVKLHLGFRISEGLPQDKILLMYHVPSHHSSKLKSDGKIICHFLPVNTITLVQHMNKELLKPRSVITKNDLFMKLFY